MPKTDDDVLRELLHRATDDLHAPSAVTAGIITRRHRRLRNARILSIATTGVAAAAMAAAVVVTRVGPPAPGRERHPAALPPVKLTAVQVLDRLSTAAAHAPQPAGRYIALTEIQSGDFSLKRTSVFDGLTGDLWTYQHGGSEPGSTVPSELPVARHFSPTRAEFATWPTNPAKLRALLISQRNPAMTQSDEGMEGSDVRLGETTNDRVFQEATSWLWNPLLSPALRSAMFKVLARTPGVTVKTGTTDKIGRPAIEISRQDSFTGSRLTAFESPSTGAVLEQSFTYAGDVGIVVYTGVAGYATLPANPYSGG